MHLLNTLQAEPIIKQDMHRYLRYMVISWKYTMIEVGLWIFSDALLYVTRFYASKDSSTVASTAEAACRILLVVNSLGARLLNLQGTAAVLYAVLCSCTLAVDFWAMTKSTHRTHVALAKCKQLREFIGKYVLPLPSLLSIAVSTAGLCWYGVEIRSIYCPHSP
jgi:hypothetical protein